jgi:hypothetical protein
MAAKTTVEQPAKESQTSGKRRIEADPEWRMPKDK